MADTPQMPDMRDLPPPPPASFEGIVQMFASQALAAMGGFPGAGGGGEARLDYAKYFIDLLEVLDAKTKSDRTADEAEMLDGVLHHLRMVYVEQKKRA